MYAEPKRYVIKTNTSALLRAYACRQSMSSSVIKKNRGGTDPVKPDVSVNTV